MKNLAVKNTLRFTVEGAEKILDTNQIEKIVKQATSRWFHKVFMKPFRLEEVDPVSINTYGNKTTYVVNSYSEFRNAAALFIFEKMNYLSLLGTPLKTD